MKAKPRAMFALLGLCAAPLALGADAYGTAASTSAPRYTFSWPLEGGEALQPRGGTTQGASVTVDTEPAQEWRKLQEPGLADFERDRRAILAMAGTYRVTFDFLEVLSYMENKPKAPYQSWGTEKIYVDKDEGKAISLVHVLEMRIVQSDGSISEPMVTKHWRQDWAYEPAYIVEYRGRDQWQRRKLSQAEAKGAWMQTVYQVDESPRYASLARWQHTASFSTWLSAQTQRPLPRREWSVRDDYQALVGTNRHTITATGWVQEENNLKAALTDARALVAAKPYVGREYGVARYERIRNADFAAADVYYERTRAFWHQVLATWQTTFEKKGQVTLRGPVDKLGLFVPLFARADEIATDPSVASTAKDAVVIRDALQKMGAIE